MATLSFSAVALAASAVDARRGGHVEALGGADELVVVDADEVAFFLALERGSGGAVGLVADDEIELRQAVKLLRAADDIERMVGGEDDAHVLGVVALLHFVGEALGVRGGGVAQLVGEGLNDVLVLARASCRLRHRSRRRSCAAGWRSPASIR